MKCILYCALLQAVDWAVRDVVQSNNQNTLDYSATKYYGDVSPRWIYYGVEKWEAVVQSVLNSHVHVIPRYVGKLEVLSGMIRWITPLRSSI